MASDRYRIVVAGELGRHYVAEFEGLEIRVGRGETEISGPFVDEAHLDAVIAHIAELGLTVVSVGRTGPLSQ